MMLEIPKWTSVMTNPECTLICPLITAFQTGSGSKSFNLWVDNLIFTTYWANSSADIFTQHAVHKLPCFTEII